MNGERRVRGVFAVKPKHIGWIPRRRMSSERRAGEWSMGIRNSRGPGRPRSGGAQSLAGLLAWTGGGRASRAALLAGASLVALAAFAAPDRALAACSGLSQTFSTPTTGPVFSDGGAIAVSGTGSVTGASGANGLDGVEATTCRLTTLTNSGAIAGGAGIGGNASGGAGLSNSNKIGTLANGGAISGGGGDATYIGVGVGGVGLSNLGTIATLTNGGTISGGGGSAFPIGGLGIGGAAISNSGSIGTLTNGGAIDGGEGFANGVGGAGVSNSGMIGTLTNNGTISGGAGFAGSHGNGGAGINNSGTIATLTNNGHIDGGNGNSVYTAGGAGVSNSGTITTLTNNDRIKGAAADSYYPTPIGGAGVDNSGTIVTLTNSGTIIGGIGSTTGSDLEFPPDAVGGAGLANSGAIATLTNSGAIRGGHAAPRGSGNATGGAGVLNSGTITTLTNSGVIAGGSASAPGTATPGDAIYSAGSGARIGTIANSGSIIGNVVIDNQSKVTITGGGETFGRWTGGTIMIGAGNLTFGGGNTFLGDNVEVDRGRGTVTNIDPLQIAAPQTITGNFTQAAAGALDLDFAGDVWGEYGALTITGLATLDGRLAIDLTNGFTLAAGDSFDILGFSGLAGPGFNALSLDGAACSARPTDLWMCSNLGGGLYLSEVIAPTLDPTSLDLVVVRGSAVPEPSTWVLLALGFLGLGGLGLKRGRAGAELTTNRA
jgi:hypothetical protein